MLNQLNSTNFPTFLRETQVFKNIFKIPENGIKLCIFKKKKRKKDAKRANIYSQGIKFVFHLWMGREM